GSRPAGAARPNGRRPGPNRRLLRQRVVVFVVVTLLVALGIAAAQGCESKVRGADRPDRQSVSQQADVPVRDGTAAAPGR
ncbi:hypothetical protein AN216_19035, partial [Streptomyces oceani]